MPPATIGKVLEDDSVSSAPERYGISRVAGACVGLAAAGLIVIPPQLLGLASVSAVAGCTAWALGWIYLAWALDAPTVRAVSVDLSLAAISLGVGLLAFGNPFAIAGLLVMHALAGLVRLKVDAANARVAVVPWTVFSSVLALGAVL